MKKTLTTLAFALGSLAAFSQQDPQYSQFMYNKLFYNPAYAGMRQALCGTLIYRDQWQGFDGAPKSGNLTVDYYNPKFGIPGVGGGIALNILSDQLGFQNNMAYRLAYSFHIPIGNNGGRLGIGLEAGAMSVRIGPTGSQQWLATQNWQTDAAIPPQLKKTTFDLGGGLWYQANNLWVGISSTHLPASTLDNGTTTVNVPTSTPPNIIHNLKYQMARHYFVMGGYNWPLGSWELRPSFMVKSDATITSFDINLTAVYNQKFWVGASYRYQDAISPMLGFMVLQNQKHPGSENALKVGFAYDYTTSGLKKYNSGSFELFLNYCIPIVVVPPRVGHQDVRIFD